MANKGPKLMPQDSLQAGDFLTSPNGLYVLFMQTDGDLVASSGAWDSMTGGNSRAYCTMLRTGDLVVYAGGRGLKHSNTPNHVNAFLTIDDNGNVHLCYPSGVPFVTNFPMITFTSAMRVMALAESAKSAVDALHEELSRVPGAGPADEERQSPVAPNHQQKGNNGHHEQRPLPPSPSPT